MDEKKQVKNLPEETELQIENANIDIKHVILDANIVFRNMK